MYESKTIYEIPSDLIIVTKFSMVQNLKRETVIVKTSVKARYIIFRENKSLKFSVKVFFCNFLIRDDLSRISSLP